MLLRSVTKHIKEQNWFAVGLDFLIVVIGILIAFQITNWSQMRDDADSYLDLRQAVIDEVRTNISIGAERSERATKYMEVAKAVIEDLESCGAQEGAVERLNKSQSTLGFIMRVHLRQNALKQMLTSELFKSGKYEDNKELFVSYARTLEFLDMNSLTNSKVSIDLMSHPFWTRGELVKSTLRGIEFEVYKSILDVDFQTACNDHSFNLAFTTRFHHGSYQRNLAQRLELESRALLEALGEDIGN